MHLENPFTQETRLRYLYVYACMDCGRSDRGLELHHITGRDSNSPLNGIVLCKECHGKVGHTHPEEARYFLINFRFLVKEHRYQEDADDYIFLENHPWLIS